MDILILIAGCLVLLTFGSLHLFMTFFSDRFHARDDALNEAMKHDSPRLTRRTTMWNAWIGFNASHSLCAMLLGTIYLLLAIRHADYLRNNPDLLLPGLLTCFMLCWLGVRYWFRTPLLGILFGTSCFVIFGLLQLP